MNMTNPKTTVVVAVSAAVSAVVAAIVVSIGVVGMVLINDRNSEPVTVTALPAGYSTAAPGAPAPAAAPAPAPPVPGAPVPAAAPVPKGGTPVAPAAQPIPAPAAGAAVAQAATPEPVATTEAAAAPTALTTDQLTAKLKVLMNGTSEQKANELEAGSAAFPTIDAVMVALKNAGPVMKWSVTGPVQLNGDTLTANIERSVPGWAPFSDPLTWKWIDGTWKLSNAGVCTLASIAFAQCSVG